MNISYGDAKRLNNLIDRCEDLLEQETNDFVLLKKLVFDSMTSVITKELNDLAHELVKNNDKITAIDYNEEKCLVYVYTSDTERTSVSGATANIDKVITMHESLRTDSNVTIYTNGQFVLKLFGDSRLDNFPYYQMRTAKNA